MRHGRLWRESRVSSTPAHGHCATSKGWHPRLGRVSHCRTRNKKVTVCMLGSLLRATIEGARHPGRDVTPRCRAGRGQQPRGRHARPNPPLRASTAHLQGSAGTAPGRTDRRAGKGSKSTASRASARAGPRTAWLPPLEALTQAKRIASRPWAGRLERSSRA